MRAHLPYLESDWVHARNPPCIRRRTAGAIWSNTMPRNLAKYLPQLSDAERATLYGSITSVATYPPGNTVREGVIRGGCRLSSWSLGEIQSIDETSV